MNLGTICQLPKETTSLIASTQIITSVSTAVKELVENSLDAGSKNIQVKLKNYGLDSIEVKDDGFGISCENVHKMFLAGYTSKISQFEDLGKLNSYGFRGEALAALCRIASVTITTKTNSDTLAMTYTIDSNGIPVSSKPSHITKGTIVAVNNLFGTLPVRKQYLSSKKKLAEELKKVEKTVQMLAVIKPELRLTLVHDNSNIFQKLSVKDLKQSFMQVFGLKLACQMEYLTDTSDQIIIDLIIPKKNLENVENLLTTSNSSMFIYINGRPISHKNITKIVMEHISLNFNLEPSNKTCISLVSISIPPSELDINLEPNKTRVLIKNEKKLISTLDDLLSTFYQHKIDRPEPEVQEIASDDDEIETQSKRPRLDPAENLLILQSRDEEFREKNSSWDLEIIGDIIPSPEKPKTICSQINSQNCTLTTDKEVKELNDALKGDVGGGVNKFNSEIKYIVDPKLTGLEKKILPEWPTRVLPEKSPVKVTSAMFEAWSTGNVETGKGRLEGGAKLLVPEVKEIPTKKIPTKKQTVLPDIFQSKNSAPKKIKKKPIRKEIQIQISLQKIFNLKNLKLQPTDKIKLLGQLKPSGNWLYLNGDEIGHVRHLGLQELIISQKMLANHSVPLKPIDKPILINEEILGIEFWKDLVSMETEHDPMTDRHVVKEEVVGMNGFRLELEKEEASGNFLRGFITQTASTIPHYGIMELKDVIALYLKVKENGGGLVDCRITPVRNYIFNESIRISQQSPRLVDRDEVQNLIDTYQCYLKHLPPQCLHSKDIFVPIYQLQDALSQSLISSQC